MDEPEAKQQSLAFYLLSFLASQALDIVPAVFLEADKGHKAHKMSNTAKSAHVSDDPTRNGDS